jgi:fatty acid desaturase
MGVRIVHGPGDLTDDDDRLLAVAPTRHVRWNRVLVWFMRILALCWIAKGLIAWAGILGLAGGTPFELRASGHQASTIYFAVIDLVAGVGLWLTSTWGGVLWLLAVMSHLILAVFFPRFVANSALLISLLIISLMMYLTISWLAAVDE